MRGFLNTEGSWHWGRAKLGEGEGRWRKVQICRGEEIRRSLRWEKGGVGERVLEGGRKELDTWKSQCLVLET